MFRPMLRFKQQLPPEECIEILKNQPRGVLSVIGDDGYPYGTPINQFYNEDDGKIYFHSGRRGHRIDAFRADPKASFCILDPGTKPEGEWYLRFRSVIVFGRIEEVTDHEKALDISRRLSDKFTDDKNYIEEEVLHSGPGVLCYALVPEHITGKLVNER